MGWVTLVGWVGLAVRVSLVGLVILLGWFGLVATPSGLNYRIVLSARDVLGILSRRAIVVLFSRTGLSGWVSLAGRVGLPSGLGYLSGFARASLMRWVILEGWGGLEVWIVLAGCVLLEHRCIWRFPMNTNARGYRPRPVPPCRYEGAMVPRAILDFSRAMGLETYDVRK